MSKKKKEMFDLIGYNNYDELQKRIDSGKPLCWVYFCKNQSLVSKAIETRAKTCFDILCKLYDNIQPNTEEYEGYNMVMSNGLVKAVEYYCIVPNPENKYYYDKLISMNMTIELNALINAINNNKISYDVFTALFNKLSDNNMNLDVIINRCLYKAIRESNIFILNIIYERLQSKNYHFYNNDYNNMMFTEAIYSGSIQTIIYMIQKNLIDWKKVNNKPSIYYLENKSIEANNYLYEKIIKLTKEELNAIEGIQNPMNIPISMLYKSKSLNYIQKILKLPIQFSDMSLLIINIFERIYKRIIKKWNMYRTISENTVLYKIMVMLLKSGYVKTNPINNINYDDFKVIYIFKMNEMNGDVNLSNIYKNEIIRFIDICKDFHFDTSHFIIPDIN